jgi:hypothetical protein
MEESIGTIITDSLERVIEATRKAVLQEVWCALDNAKLIDKDPELQLIGFAEWLKQRIHHDTP